jgi:DNA-binding transcriptional ArsR family regulator
MDDTLDSRRCARLLKAVGDPERLRIIQCLRAGEKTVGEVASELEIPIVKASHHLRILRHAELLQDEKRGRFVSYRLHPDVFVPARSTSVAGHIDLGCCRIEIPKK